MAADNIVKQSVSERLAGLKFMQRAKIRDDERKKQEAEELGSSTTGDSHWVTLGVTSRAKNSRCRVITEGTPPPAVMGRMSFGNRNPAVEKLMEEALARRNRMRNATRASSGKEETRVVSTPQASANDVEHGNIEADDTEKISIRKRQKVVKVEKLTKTEATFMKANSSSIGRGGNNDNETNKHHQQQRGTKQVNPKTDWKN